MSTSQVIVGLVLSLISAASTASNILVFVAVGSSSHLRTVSNVFIVSLSVADILVATVVMIPATLNQVYGEWVLPQEFCSIWTSFDVMLCSASVLNVCAISLDRYLAIISPLRYKSIMTFRRAAAILTLLWTVALLSSFVPIKNGWHLPRGSDGAWANAMPSLDNLTWSGDTRPICMFKVSLSYALLAGSITILFPIVVAIVLYFKVSGEARRQALFVRTLIVGPSRLLLGQDVTSSSSNAANKSLRDPPFTRKATVTLGVIVGAYVVTWTPFLVVNVVEAQCACVPPDLFTAIVWLGYCNSLINPIIYPLLMRDFRKVYMRLLLSCCPRLKQVLKRKSNPVTDTCTNVGGGGDGGGRGSGESCGSSGGGVRREMLRGSGFNNHLHNGREEFAITTNLLYDTKLSPSSTAAVIAAAAADGTQTPAVNGHSNSIVSTCTTTTTALVVDQMSTSSSSSHLVDKSDT